MLHRHAHARLACTQRNQFQSALPLCQCNLDRYMQSFYMLPASIALAQEMISRAEVGSPASMM